MLSMNSFNSSLNFAKLQSSINFRATSNFSENPQYERSKRFKRGGETMLLEDVGNYIANPVKEESYEDESEN